MKLERLYGVREGSANPKGIVVGSSSANGASPERQFTESELASKLGIGVDTLKRAKKLASLPSEIQDLVEVGNIVVVKLFWALRKILCKRYSTESENDAKLDT